MTSENAFAIALARCSCCSAASAALGWALLPPEPRCSSSSQHRRPMALRSSVKPEVRGRPPRGRLSSTVVASLRVPVTIGVLSRRLLLAPLPAAVAMPRSGRLGSAVVGAVVGRLSAVTKVPLFRGTEAESLALPDAKEIVNTVSDIEIWGGVAHL